MIKKYKDNLYNVGNPLVDLDLLYEDELKIKRISKKNL